MMKRWISTRKTSNFLKFKKMTRKEDSRKRKHLLQELPKLSKNLPSLIYTHLSHIIKALSRNRNRPLHPFNTLTPKPLTPPLLLQHLHQTPIHRLNRRKLRTCLFPISAPTRQNLLIRRGKSCCVAKAGEERRYIVIKEDSCYYKT